MKLELKHLAPYLPYGLKVQYKGIVNTKELSAYKKLEPKNVDLLSAEYSKYWDNIPQPIYGLKISEIKQIKLFKKYITIHLGVRHGHLKTCFFSDIKPILRPLSDLTKEIEVNGEKFVPIIELAKLFHICKSAVTHFSNIRNAGFYGISVNCHIENDDGRFTYYQIRNEEFVLSNTYEEVQKLLEWHFDVFGLIPQGLAIDINTIEK